MVHILWDSGCGALNTGNELAFNFNIARVSHKSTKSNCINLNIGTAHDALTT